MERLGISLKSTAVLLLGLMCGIIFLGQDLRIGVRIRAFDVGLLTITVLLGWSALTRGVARQSGPFLASFAAFAFYVAGNAALQGSEQTAIKELSQLGLFAVFFLALVQYLDDRQSVALFVAVFLATLWILAMHNVYVHAAQGVFAGWKDLGDQKLSHSMIIVIMAAITVSPFRPKGFWWVCLLIVAVVLLFLSGERKGWVATALAVFCVLAISDHGGIRWRALRRTCGVVAGAGVLLALAALIAPLVPYLEKQLFSSFEAASLLWSDGAGTAADTTVSNRNRLAMIEIAMQQIREHPVFGIGPDAFRENALARAFLPLAHGDIATGPHNEILRIGAELGGVGLALYAMVYVVLAYRAVVLLAAMPTLDAGERLLTRLGVAFVVYGFAVNLFLAGGGLNTFFVTLPAGLLFAVRARAPVVAGAIMRIAA